MFRKLLVVIVLLVTLLAGCRTATPELSVIQTPGAAQSPLSESPPPTPTVNPLPAMDLEEGKAGIEGRLIVFRSWRDREVTIYAAPFTQTESENQGFYVLEPSVHPSDKLDENGYFQIENIDPGAYVLIAGPHPDEGVPIEDPETGQPMIHRVEGGEVLDIGEYELN